MNEESSNQNTGISDQTTQPTNDKQDVQSINTIPESPDGYEIPKSQFIPFSEEEDKSFRDLAHKLKLTSEQVKELGSWANSTGEKNLNFSIQTNEKFKQNSMNNLKAQWGLNCEENLRRAVKTSESLAEKYPDFKEFLEETGVGNDPRFIKTMAEIGNMMSEDSLPYSGSSSSKSGYIGSMPILDFSSMDK